LLKPINNSSVPINKLIRPKSIPPKVNGLSLFSVMLLVAGSLCMAMMIRVPAPRMALDNGGAAIAIRELDVWAGSNNLIETFDWRIMPKERWSLLGPNGCGKSTLLRTIAAAAAAATERGELSNTIAVNPRLRFGMLEQTAVSGSDRGVKEEVMSHMATPAVANPGPGPGPSPRPKP
jgi:hypothetical protein